MFLCRVPWLKFNIPTVADFHVLYSSHGHCNVVFSSSIESGRPSSPAKDKGEMNLRSRIILYIHRKVGWQISIFLLTASHKISRNGPYIPFNFEESFYPMNLFISSCSSFHLMPRKRFHSLSSRYVMLSLNWGHKRRNVVSSQQGAQGPCQPPSWPICCTSWRRPSRPRSSLETWLLQILFNQLRCLAG